MSSQNAEWPTVPRIQEVTRASFSAPSQPTPPSHSADSIESVLLVVQEGEEAPASVNRDLARPQPKAAGLQTPGRVPDPNLAASTGGELEALRTILLGSTSQNQDARLDNVERRLDALTARLSELQASARGSDVTLRTLAALQQEVTELQEHQAHIAGDVLERERLLDDRCRLRQRRLRTASTLELRRLRRERWPGGGVSRGSGSVGVRQTPASPPNEPAGSWSAAAGNMGPEAPLDAGNAYALRDAGAAGQAWRAVHRSGVALVSALAALLVVLAHLAVEDMRAAGQRIGEVLRR